MNTEDTKVLEEVKLERINLTDDPLPGHEITVVEDNIGHRVTLADQPQPPLLNRAQRRSLRRYIAHKAALQVRHVLAKRRKMATKQAKIARALAKQAKYVAGIIS